MKNFLLVFAFIACSLNLIAQQTIRRSCGTMEHLQMQLQEDPGLAQRMIENERTLQQWIANNPSPENSVFTIPVVFHVVYKNTSQNISDAQVLSQLTVLNEDFNRLNSDTANTPAPWKAIAANTNIQFCIAQTDPNGNPTNGITRTSTPSSSSFTPQNNNVKRSTTGGKDGWPPQQYFNIWICDLGSFILGYGQFASSGINSTYGLVLNYRYTGRGGASQFPFNLGRTGTHEVGHCLNLYHIWGDDDANFNSTCDNVSSECNGTDYCNDTPNQCVEFYDAPTYPQTDFCSPNNPGVMFMNYMDYTDDRAMNLFTLNQSSRMNATCNVYLTSLNSSTVCNSPTNVYNPYFGNNFNLYPNPANQEIVVSGILTSEQDLVISVFDAVGSKVSEMHAKGFLAGRLVIDMRSLVDGLYFVQINSLTGTATKSVVVQH